jgi:cell surface protein SprA
MTILKKYLLPSIFLLAIAWFIINPGYSGIVDAVESLLPENDSIKDKTSLEKLPSITDIKSPLIPKTSPKLDLEIVFDSEKGEYVVRQKLGNKDFGVPKYMSVDEFKSYDFEQSIYKYWKEKSDNAHMAGGDNRLVGGRLRIGGGALDKVLGDNAIEIIPQGSAELSLGVKINKLDNPSFTENQKSTVTFDYDSKIQANVTGKVGDKFKVNFDYNTEATFDFENNVKIEYKGDEDEIIQRIEAGNVTFPLSGTLITGSQSLFGIKTDLQFGKLSVSGVFSQQRGESSVIEVKGGAQTQSFEIRADEYEANKHFFLAQYFRENYNKFVATLPLINSGIRITRVEVWVTNKTSEFKNSRNILGLMDLAERGANISNPLINSVTSGDNPMNLPDNKLNDLYTDLKALPGVRAIESLNSTLNGYKNFKVGRDYEKIESARKLDSREYKVNYDLGFVTVNTSLNNDEVLAVAFEFQSGGKTYQVGEFSNDVKAPDVLMLKLIKGTNITPKLNTWHLMMKNVYATGGYQLSSDGFFLDIMYEDDKAGTSINYIPAGNLNKKMLLQVLGFDRVNNQGFPTPDAIYDYVEGVTVLSSNGRVFLPTLEPFGQDLYDKFDDPNLAKKYAFTALYDSTITKAKEQSAKNKFKIMGSFKSSGGSDIQLNAMNIPKGSVKVSAGGIELVENIDYTVDYTLGRVKIVNPAYLESGTPLRISTESNSLFNIQTKTLLGTHLNYQFNDDFNIGATIMSLSERPLTQKVDFGNQPIHNVIWGLDGSYKTESRLLTKLVDKIPLIETKEISSIAVSGEFAQFLPGQSKAVGSSGVTYLDDFEGAESPFSLDTKLAWYLASVPQLQPSLFKESSETGLETGFNRARLAWYNIDPLFQDEVALTPSHIKSDKDQRSNHYVRLVYEQELFPAKESQNYETSRLTTFNLAYYPDERGPYNYETSSTSYSAGINNQGKLSNPTSRWAGIMRKLDNNNFEQSNIEYIEFWLMDPFFYDPDHKGGDLYLNLGNVSEDILKDSRKSFENGLPKDALVVDVDTTVWGRMPVKQPVTTEFDNTSGARQFQDIGLDGLNNTDEQSFFSSYVSYITANVTNAARRDSIVADPSGDDFVSNRGSVQDQTKMTILNRYKYYNNPQGNSPENAGAGRSAKLAPDREDINGDNTLSEVEAYYQYKISLRPEDLVQGGRYITDIAENDSHKLPNGTVGKVKWYQFKIPVSEFSGKFGPIDDFTSIRFMRMFLKNFNNKVVLRFTSFKLVRSEWRKIDKSFSVGHEGLSTPESSNTNFVVSTVSVEKNGNRNPIPYVLPPGIEREKDYTTNQTIRQNEQALSIKIEDLKDGDARAIYKQTAFDIRSYNKLKLEIHAEAVHDGELKDKDLNLFIRLGSDFKDNYYEYEIPLHLTPFGSNVAQQIWPEDNRLNLDLQKFVDLKLSRNKAMKKDANVSYTTRYTLKDGENYLSIAGNPTMANIQTMVIGIRNPAQNVATVSTDDGLSKSAEIWVNELRVSNPDESGGWAASGRMTTKLADFATISLAGSITMPGFGSIDKKIHELSKDKIYSYDITTNFRLGKFFPEQLKVNMPLFVGFSQGFINPMYDPVNTDVKLEESLKNYDTKAEKDSIKFVAQDFTERKSLNFSNIQINRSSKKPQFYDPANFSLSYSYNSQFHRDINTKYNYSKTYKGAFNYVYNMRPKPVTPFKRVNFLKSKYTRLISDFNFFYLPSQLSFRTDITRQYTEVKFRNITQPDLDMPTSVNKDFLWNRYYTMKFDLTQSLKLDYKATVRSRIQEPDTIFGVVNKDRYSAEYDYWKKEVWSSIMDGGDPIQYNHTIDASYRVPINKLPMLDWTSANVNYSANYSWDYMPYTADTLNVGNKIQNSTVIQANGQLNFLKLYNKVKYLKGINQEFDRLERAKKRKKKVDVEFVADNQRLRARSTKRIKHNLGTTNVNVRITDDSGNRIDSLEYKAIDKNTVRIRSFVAVPKAQITVSGKIAKKEKISKIITRTGLRLLMSVRDFRISYSLNQGTFVPGYDRSSSWFGMSGSAPGVPFILGYQDNNFGQKALNNGWLTNNPRFNSYYTMNTNRTLVLRSKVELIKGLKIDLTANRSYSKNSQQLFGGPANVEQMQTYNGNFSISVITLKTAFEFPDGDNNFKSSAYDDFKAYRKIISNRQADAFLNSGKSVANNEIDPSKSDSEGYREGFGSTSQEVILPAFLAAYTGQDASKVDLKLIKDIPAPNWKITFNTLSTFYGLKKTFKTFNLNHSYSSVYSIGSFLNGSNYNIQDGVIVVDVDKLDAQRNLPSEMLVSGGISISEKFAPLVGFDLTTNSNITGRFAYNRSRNLTFGFENNQLVEDYSKEWIIGLGYRFTDLSFIFKSSNNSKLMNSTLNLRADFGIKDNINIIRKLSEDVNDVTGGRRSFSLRATADMVISSQLNFIFYFERKSDTPYTSATYKRSDTQVGFTLRFNLSQ